MKAGVFVAVYTTVCRGGFANELMYGYRKRNVGEIFAGRIESIVGNIELE